MNNATPSRKRKRNTHRERSTVDQKIDLWSDGLFKRQFRLNRECFMYLSIGNRSSISNTSSKKSKQSAINSSGFYISNKLRL